MAPVHSKRLLYLPDSSSHSTSATVPDGFIWTVRDIAATQMNVGPGATQGMVVSVFTTSFDRYTIWNLRDSDTLGFVTYRWNGNQILNPGDSLQISSSIAHWTVVISGYQLSLP